LQFSLYGPETVHDAVTGRKGSFESLQRTLQNIEPLRKYFHLKFCIPVMRDNIGAYSKIAELAENYNVPFSISPLKEKGPFSPAGTGQVSPGEYEEFLTGVDHKIRKKNLWPLDNRLRNLAYLKMYAGSDYGDCDFRANTIIVFSDGQYAFCDFDAPEGNLLNDQGLEEKLKKIGKKKCVCMSYAYLCGKYLGNLKNEHLAKNYYMAR
jgi:sulfatase maturation enzyme AslB (radical SAM superfamily)